MSRSPSSLSPVLRDLQMGVCLTLGNLLNPPRRKGE